MTTKKASSSIDTWDPQNFHVQREVEQGKFTNSKYVLISAGPPRLSDSSLAGESEAGGEAILGQGAANIAFPLGVTNQFGLQQSKNWAKIYEIGSARSYLMPGHTDYGLNLARIIYNGPSLMKCLMAFYQGKLANSSGAFSEDDPRVVHGIADENLPDIYESAGSGDLFLNLASDLFDQTPGILVIFEDSKHRRIGAIYLEECAIRNHALQLAAEQFLLFENASLMPNRLVPVDVQIDTTRKSSRVWAG